MSAGVVAVVCGNTAGQIRLNVWQRDFFDALERGDFIAFWEQLLMFGAIVSILLVLVVSQAWLREMLNVRLREWLTHELLDQWMAPKRAYQLGRSGPIGANPEHRIHQDAQQLSDFTTILAVGLLQSSLLLLSFVGVLWALSETLVFIVGDRRFAISGYMVWCALAYALGGSMATWWVGRSLIPLNAERYAREGRLRRALVTASEHAERNESGPRDRIWIDSTLDAVIAIMRLLAYRLSRLTWVTSGYGWLGLVVPILVAAPGYFKGTLSFGELMMVVGAFTQVQSSLRWFVDNFAQVAEWRAALLRVTAFRDALRKMPHCPHDR